MKQFLSPPAAAAKRPMAAPGWFKDVRRWRIGFERAIEKRVSDALAWSHLAQTRDLAPLDRRLRDLERRVAALRATLYHRDD